MADANNNFAALTFATTGTVKNVQDFGFASQPNQWMADPGYESSLYASTNGRVKKIFLDQSSLAFNTEPNLVGRNSDRGVFPALDFVYCADDPLAPTPAPTIAAPTQAPIDLPTAFPITAPTPAPIDLPTPFPITAQTPAPTDLPTPFPITAPAPAPTDLPTPFPITAPTPAPTDLPTPLPTTPPVDVPDVKYYQGAGNNGDPIIMGLSGQIFKFDGRPGAWYSAASAKSFQWNMKVQKFEECPNHSDTFITGVGMSVFGKHGKKHAIEVNVVNEFNTDIGCGNVADKTNDYSCLGAGSLQIIIDGHKIVQTIDHVFDDNSGRVTAFNTIAKCSRRWFDFDVTPIEELGNAAKSSFRGRRLAAAPDKSKATADFMDILERVRNTMIDEQGCGEWMNERRVNNDIFKQSGTWSTVMVQTDTISLHIEYKQEQERCSAHNLDVWISSVSPETFNEKWAGVIGETKNVNFDKASLTKMKHMSRAEALTFRDDEAYEVLSPYSSKCKGCIKK